MELIVVDCENCSDASVVEISLHSIYSDIVLVVGALQSKDKYTDLGRNTSIIQCTKVGKNAADFVIVAVLTQMAIRNKYNRVTIVSNDTGFDSAIDYLSSIGINIRRKSSESQLMSRCLASMCGYIANNAVSGVSYRNLSKICQGEFNGKFNKLIRELRDLGIIKMVYMERTQITQIYFSKKRLKEISRMG